jgi:hypothetical protein
MAVGGGMMGITDLDFRVADPRGTGGALEGSPRGPQQQNPYDSLKKLFGGNLQRSGGGFGGGLQDLFGRIGQQTGQMQGSPNSEYEGRNPDGSSFRLQFPMGNNPPPPIDYKGRPDILQPTGPQQPRNFYEAADSQPLREEVGDTFNRRIQGQMGQNQGRRQAPQQMQVVAGDAINERVRQARQREMNLMSRILKDACQLKGKCSPDKAGIAQHRV